ncbi:MAG: hypothetical protein ACXV2C_00425 [Candidatus Bathyarchaeia archaeon]
MCVVSAVGQYWSDTFPQRNPGIQIPTGAAGGPVFTPWQTYVTQEQFNALKKDVEELKTLLIAAKKFDEATGQPDCEFEDKVALIKAVAKMVGVDMKDIFPDQPD